MDSRTCGEHRVAPGDRVEVEYVLEAKPLTRSDSGRAPRRSEARLESGRFHYRHGADHVAPEIEASLAGLEVGESQRIRLTPEREPTPYDPEARMTVPLDAIPPDSRREGAHVVTRGPVENEVSVVEVCEVRADEVVLDVNPLQLTIEMTVASVD